MSSSDLNFHIGDKVVYPNHGVGVIEQISSRSIGATIEKFYLLLEGIQELERRRHRERVDRGAEIVAEPRKGQLLGPRAAAKRRLGLVDRDRPADAGQLDGGGEPVRTGPHDDGI